jgi:beta-N-acetylhexosaminidase
LEEWERTFGRLYRAAIKAGVLSVMSGHIAFPAFVKSIDPNAGVEAFRPASVSRVLNQTLLRERLGFNGLIVSDATPMAGLGAWASRAEAIPDVIASGCDMILFSPDAEGDVEAIRAAVAAGRLTQARIDEAVVRVLGFKAALKLHLPQATAAPVFGTKENKAISRAITARAPTLVKDTQKLLPLDPKKHRRVLVITPGIVMPFLQHPIPFALPEMLKTHGFEVTMHGPETVVTREHFDLVLYLFGDETLLTRAHIFVDWLRLAGNVMNAMQRTWHDIPTLMISFGYPYLLYDAPRVPTYINAYSTLDEVQQAVVDALLGNAKWNRNNPVDPFCGLEDARY